MDIKMLALDLDSTLTDGKYYVSESGEIMKSFFTRDFSAMQELDKSDITILVVTNSTDRVLQEKIKTLKYCINIMVGVKNKVEAIENFIKIREKVTWKDKEVTWDNIAYIGDAENDIECIEKACFSCCPNDAIPEIKEKVDFVSSYNGGNGAVWEFAKEILKLNKANFRENS